MPTLFDRRRLSLEAGLQSRSSFPPHVAGKLLHKRLHHLAGGQPRKRTDLNIVTVQVRHPAARHLPQGRLELGRVLGGEQKATHEHVGRQTAGIKARQPLYGSCQVALSEQSLCCRALLRSRSRSQFAGHRHKRVRRTFGETVSCLACCVPLLGVAALRLQHLPDRNRQGRGRRNSLDPSAPIDPTVQEKFDLQLLVPTATARACRSIAAPLHRAVAPADAAMVRAAPRLARHARVADRPSRGETQRYRAGRRYLHQDFHRALPRTRTTCSQSLACATKAGTTRHLEGAPYGR